MFSLALATSCKGAETEQESFQLSQYSFVFSFSKIQEYHGCKNSEFFLQARKSLPRAEKSIAPASYRHRYTIYGTGVIAAAAPLCLSNHAKHFLRDQKGKSNPTNTMTHFLTMAIRLFTVILTNSATYRARYQSSPIVRFHNARFQYESYSCYDAEAARDAS